MTYQVEPLVPVTLQLAPPCCELRIQHTTPLVHCLSLKHITDLSTVQGGLVDSRAQSGLGLTVTASNQSCLAIKASKQHHGNTDHYVLACRPRLEGTLVQRGAADQ